MRSSWCAITAVTAFLSRMNVRPVANPTRWRTAGLELRVIDAEPIAEHALESIRQLGSERNLGYEHQHLFALLQLLIDKTDIYHLIYLLESREKLLRLMKNDLLT